MTPTTAAGRALADRAKREAWSNWEGLAQFTIPRIEAEARADERARIAALVDQYPPKHYIKGRPQDRLAALLHAYFESCDGTCPHDDGYGLLEGKCGDIAAWLSRAGVTLTQPQPDAALRSPRHRPDATPLGTRCIECGEPWPCIVSQGTDMVLGIVGDADRLLYVLDGWLGQDDWGVETYPYPDTVKDLLNCLKAGDDPRALRLMAQQRGFYNPNPTGWRARTFWSRCPAYLSMEYGRRSARRASAS